jgi:uncharacterized damage-inducible protein DinB
MPSFRVRLAALCVAPLVIAASATAARAQDVPTKESALEVRARFLSDLDTLQKKMLALADAFPAEKYSWRPAPGVRSVGEVFMHVASEYYLYTPMAYGGAPSTVIPRQQGAMKQFESQSTKADVLKHLNDAFAYMKQQIAGLDPAAITGAKKLFGENRTIIETSFIMSGDLHEHLGQLIAYARMNGVVPPWSK